MYIYTRGELSQGAAGERVQGSVCSLRLTRTDGWHVSVCLSETDPGQLGESPILRNSRLG